MRQGQHKSSRSRSRGRRSSSSLSRVFESNGPDVKVRGTAQHVADKYIQLARDAQAAGDTVMAENYFQHAEHYLRILAAAQSYTQQYNPHYQPRRPGGEEEIFDEADELAGEEEQPSPLPQPRPAANPVGGEPAADAGPADKTWGGPQPEFLRRGSSPNGSSRSRREHQQSRGGNGQSEGASSSAAERNEIEPAVEDSEKQQG